MSEYSFILDNIKFSYSGVNTFKNCPHSYKLNYIDAEKNIENAFGQFGLLIHNTMEKYFGGEIDIWDLSDYYEDNYDKVITVDYPPNPFVDLSVSYREAGRKFFDNFEFPREKYEVVSIEDKIDFDLPDGRRATARPDLILREIETDRYILFDYKTAKKKTVKKQKEKQLTDYMNQMQLYVYAYWLKTGIQIAEIDIWFIRDNYIHKELTNVGGIQDSLIWFNDTIKEIMEEENWLPYDVTPEDNEVQIAEKIKKNEFFCGHICGVRRSCNFFKNMLQLET